MPHEFECFKIAFKYVQQHRFARIKDAVSSLHLVGENETLHPEFRAMIRRVYRAVRESLEEVQSIED
jgi:hypothetical protein